MIYFLDANIIIRLLTDEKTPLSNKAYKIIREIQKENIKAVVSTLVIHEVTYVLKSVYNQPRSKISSSLLELFKLKNLSVNDISKAGLKAALNDFSKYTIDFPDCVYAQQVKENNWRLASFDKDFNKLEVETFDTA